MAASCVRVVRTTVTGLHFPSWHPSTFLRQTPTLSRCLWLHTSQLSSAVEQQKFTPTHRTGKEAEEDEGPEYIPRKKAKNPMMKIGYAWMIGLPTGIIGFIMAKRQVDKNRLKQLKIRQRMKRSNEGDYDGSRYQHHASANKLD